ncbi:uncharacterized protein LOC131159345 [Malania oleifera]|uniref:uncharacterized protein LOC131159345 n=1 Tax=Malania oleifera TaxID=397392 RepID=UPI0025AE6DAE|nr:uncharacterized protein LOC131159345 [Malania oleifera]
MEARGGCCIARYAGVPYDAAKVDRIMLRFRPIAPKPASGAAVPGVSPPESCPRGGRGKRRCGGSGGRESAGRRCVRKRKASSETESPVVTLPLLPETPVWKDSPASPTRAASEVGGLGLPSTWLNFGSERKEVEEAGEGVVGSWVTVERVTGTRAEGEWSLGRTDEERRRNLEGDECPGFISDGWNRVGWTNGAYRRMAAGGAGNYEKVGVVMKEGVPRTCEAFACRVRVQCGGKERSSAVTMPCDAWRMDAGGFAWRLDVHAALSLGR